MKAIRHDVRSNTFRKIIDRFGGRRLEREAHSAARAARATIRRQPFRHVGAATVAGVVAGVAVMMLLRSRD